MRGNFNLSKSVPLSNPGGYNYTNSPLYLFGFTKYTLVPTIPYLLAGRYINKTFTFPDYNL